LHENGLTDGALFAHYRSVMIEKPKSPAEVVIAIMGGDDAVAGIIGRHRTTVTRWRQPREKGGTGGLVPAEHQQPLLDEARRIGKDLRPEHFFQPSIEKLGNAASPVHANPAEKVA
jgi:hypothetical protein